MECMGRSKKVKKSFVRALSAVCLFAAGAFFMGCANPSGGLAILYLTMEVQLHILKLMREQKKSVLQLQENYGLFCQLPHVNP